MYEKKIIENLRKYAHIYAYDNQELSETCLRAYNSIEMLLYKYKMSLNEIEELQKPQWISVEERLPERNTFVIACDKYGNVYERYYKDGWNMDGEKIRYWMPLPEPPEPLRNPYVINKIPSADVQPVGYTLEECGNYLLFLWMENILTDAEHNRAVERFNKKIHEKRMDDGT